MKYQANGGYQILNFEGTDIESVSSLDYDVLSYAIKRQKVLMVVGLLIGTTLVNCIANASLDETNDKIILELGTKKLVVSDDNSVEVKDTTENKKLYFHPIAFANRNTASPDLYKYALYCVIINNNNTKINTIEDLVAYIHANNFGRMGLQGTIYDKANARIGSVAYVDIATEQQNIIGVWENGDDLTIDLSTLTPTSMIDGVNEIYPNIQ